MSYLLEALRKSERERQEKSAVPSLQSPTVEWESGEETRSRSPWLMVAVLAICLNTILLAVLVWRFGFAESRFAESHLADSRVAENPTAAKPVEQTKPAMNTTTAMPQVIVLQQPSEPSAAIVVRERNAESVLRPVLARKSASGLEEPQRTDDLATIESQSTAETATVERTQTTRSPREASFTNEAPPSVHALPVSIRQQLPPLTMNSHIYANNVADSFVMINGVSLSPGQIISEGLKLIAVVPEGVVLDINGQRFLLPALASFTP